MATLLQALIAKRGSVLGLRACTVTGLLWWVLTLTAGAAQAISEPNAQQLLDNMRFQRLLTGEDENQKGGIGVVFAIVQDDTGFLWFGGDSGLARYDAHTFKFYSADAKNPRALASIWVSDMRVDHDGVLWLATGGGLSRYNRETDDFTTVRAQGGAGLNLLSDLVAALEVDSRNNLYIGTAGGLTVFNPERSAARHYTFAANDPQSLGEGGVSTLFVDSEDRLWLGMAGGGLSRFDPATQTFVHWRNDPADPSSLMHNHVDRIAQDDKGRIWVATRGYGLARLLEDGRSFKVYRHDPDDPRTIGSDIISDIHSDRRGNLWIATDHGGLALYNEQSDAFFHLRHHVYDRTTLHSDQLRRIYEDHDGNLWVGAVPTGVSFYDAAKARFRTLTHQPDNPNSLDHNGVLSLLQDRDGIIWIGTEKGLNAYNRHTGQFTRYQPNPKDPDSLRFGAITALAEDKDGSLWVGSWSGGLHRFDKHTGKFKNYYPEPGKADSLIGAHIWNLALDHDNDLWIGAIDQGGGMSQYLRDSDSFRNFRHNPQDANSLAYNFVWRILPDRHGQLWIGTQNGLDRFNKADQTFQHYRHDPDDAHSLSHDNVISLLEDRAGRLWVGTAEGGVSVLDTSSGRFRTLGIDEGLPAAHVATLVEDRQGHIWAGTPAGLARIDPADFAVTVLRKSDGLAGSNINRNASLLADNGELYIGSTKGLTVFAPEHIEQNQTPPKVMITELRILNHEVTVGTPDSPLSNAIEHTRELTLSYKDAMFAFDFAALSFSSSRQNRYWYKLDGFDQAWNDVGSARTATYTNLNPGDYTFRVRAINNAGVPSAEDAQIRITITPPPWRTVWAYLGYALLGAAGLYLRKRYTDLRKKSAEYHVLSTTDALTGVLNRTGLQQALEQRQKADKAPSQISVMVMDIDHFKRINDSRGHDAGDRILRAFAEIIGASVRTQDSLARWGGEEFVLVCYQAPLAAASAIGEKLRQAVAQHRFEAQDRPLSLTVSIGIACSKPGESFEQLFKRADIALYNAKSGGRNRVEVADDP
ncbi:MAG TPA: two-component regulator propeller domain-containing protein [Marinagarivorans sp.]